MYISLALVWICFKIIHVENVRCPIGEMTDEKLCTELRTKTLMNKFYIRSLELQLVKNPKNRFEEFDIPFKEEEISITGSKKPLKSTMLKRYDPNLRYYKIFRKSLISNNTASILERWNEALDIGTDTYMIKFHNQLEHSTRQPSSYEECMVYIQSSYNAANILYLYQKYKMAFEIINNGLKYFESNTELCTSKQIRNAKMWSILLISLSFDIMKNMDSISNSQKLETKNKILSGIKEYNEAYYGSFPILAIIFVRKLFLEMETSSDMYKELKNWLLTNQLDMSMENDDLYKKYITTYKSFLIFFHNSDLNNTFNNIFKAIEKPVLNIEDRLLNYFAIESTLTEVNKYIQEHDTDEFIMDKFSIFEDYVKNNNDLFDLRLTTIPKLRILYDRSNTNFIKMLYEDLKMKNKIINENILYLILSSMLNMNTQPKQLYNDNKRNVEIAMDFLKTHLDFHNQLMVNDDSKPASYDYEVLRGVNTGLGVFCYELESIAKTEYNKENQLTNHFIATKWLMEFNGIFSKKSGRNWNDYSKHFVEMFQKAKNLEDIEKKYLGTENFKNDQHFMFLKAKYMSKSLLPLDDWEMYNMPGEWHFEPPKYIILSSVSPTSMFELLTKLQRNSNYRYINKIELLTIIFRYHQRYTKDNDAMYSIIKEAISEPVITPEDRMRNLVAHELFSMVLMERNNIAIKKANDLGVSEAFNQFLRDPKLRKKTNSGL